MTSTIDRAEINRRNARKSTGPRTTEGKARSRFNAVKHGCRAKLPVLPGEDPEAYERRLDAWIDKFAPRDAVEHYLVERAVNVSWQLDRADRAEVARLADEIAADAGRVAENVEALGARLFRAPAGRLGAEAVADGERDGLLLSWPFDPDHSDHPARLVAALEATAAGCEWLLARWADLDQLLDHGRTWRPIDRLRAIRMLGKQPLDVIADDQLMTLYLSCHALDPDGPDVFAEPLADLHRPEMQASRERLSARFAAARAERAPRDAAAARATLRAIVAAAVARVEALREVRDLAEAADAADISARLSYSTKEVVEWLRKHQVTCSRALFRTFEELRKIRRDFAGDLSADEPAPAPGPGVDEAEEMSAPFPYELVEPEESQPTGPLAVEPVSDQDAPTNEASHAGSSDVSASDDDGSVTASAGTVTNEASEDPGEDERGPSDAVSREPATRPFDIGVGRSGLSHRESVGKACEQSPVRCYLSAEPAIASASASADRPVTDLQAIAMTVAIACSRATLETPKSAEPDQSGPGIAAA